MKTTGYVIVKIDWETFPTDCQPHIKDEDLPHEVFISDDAGVGDPYRADAAWHGILSHNPYCEKCEESS